MTSRIDNPNRVGSGFINFGAMERNTQPAANWQTGSLVQPGHGGAVAPPQVSEIWNAAPNKQPAPPQPTIPQMPVPPQPFAAQPGSAAPFAASPPAEPHSLLHSIGALGLGPSTQASAAALQAAQVQRPPVVSAPFPSMGAGMPPVQPAQVQSFMNGAAPTAPPQQSSLMSMLSNPPPPPAPSLTPAFGGGLGNGTVPNAGASRVNAAAFASVPPQVAQPFQPPPQAASFGAPPAGFGAPPNSARTAPPPAAAAVPKVLASAADYGQAAMAYKPPPSSQGQSVSRKPEQQSAGSARGSTPRVPETRPAEEWECRRCTFINNASLWECEICSFDRPGKHEQQEAAKAATPRADSDSGWRTASAARKPPPQPASNSNSAAASGKSKAQSKNEKRRAKKRTDGTFE
uniref:RanBP2-type domain-containing protein n=1 Tax=Haptolina brevifila TaxID=156173 RepID=A0A7S2BY54_9EUKA